MKRVSTEIIVGSGLAILAGAYYLYRRNTIAQNKADWHRIEAQNAQKSTASKPALVLRSSGNTVTGTSPIVGVAANPKPFTVTDVFNPNILF